MFDCLNVLMFGCLDVWMFGCSDPIIIKINSKNGKIDIKPETQNYPKIRS